MSDVRRDIQRAERDLAEDEPAGVGRYAKNTALGAMAGVLLLRGSHKLDKLLKKRFPNRKITTADGGEPAVRRSLNRLGAITGGGMGFLGTRVNDQLKELNRNKNRK